MSPSLGHETFIRMFRERPTLVADLLADRLGVAVPEFHKADVWCNDLTVISLVELWADAVVVRYDGDEPALAVVVEIQLNEEERERYSWPLYVAAPRARLKCPVTRLGGIPS